MESKDNQPPKQTQALEAPKKIRKLELVPNEVPKKPENPARQETIRQIIHEIGVIAKKGDYFEDFYDNSQRLNPKDFDGYTSFAVRRSTLPDERIHEEDSLARLRLTKTKEDIKEIITYDISKEEGEYRIDRIDLVETYVEQEQRKRNLAKFGQEGLDSASDFINGLFEKEKLEIERKTFGESLVEEPEALEVLAHLQKIDGAYGKTKSR